MEHDAKFERILGQSCISNERGMRRVWHRHRDIGFNREPRNNVRQGHASPSESGVLPVAPSPLPAGSMTITPSVANKRAVRDYLAKMVSTPAAGMFVFTN